MIKVLKPGIQYYADRIKGGQPFSLIRFGDGFFVLANPEIRRSKRLERQGKRPGLVEAAINTLRGCPVHDNFIVGLWQQHWFARFHYTEIYENWIAQNMDSRLQFHHGRVWVSAIHAGEFFPIIDAMKGLKLPVKVIGPSWLQSLGRVTGLNVRRHYCTDMEMCWFMHDSLKEELLDHAKEPSIYLFCAGSLKSLIVELWPTVGQNSFMLDFGGALNVLCGYHMAKTGPPWDVTLTNLWKDLERTRCRGIWGSLEIK